ncbi:MAG TPA: hypothetical protein VJ885_12775 [Thermoanaerobaculia bacterium]|nr:hypothetical protein [Thermoanaerobaculia bacterium]
MLNRNFVLATATALTLASFAVPASAQTYYFGVHSTSQTLGYPGTFTDDSQLQPGGLSADTLSDPQGATMSAPGYATLFADVAAGSEARQAELRAQASGHAHVVSGTNVGSASAPYGFAYSRFYDRLTVTSDVLPKGTPVTIVFGNDVEIHRWDRIGAYDGYIDMTLQVATGTARSRWSSHYLYGDTTAVAPALVINTKVGTQLSVDARLRVMAKVFYKLNTSGDNYADATARLVIREIPDGVTLQADSGTIYPIVPAN